MVRCILILHHLARYLSTAKPYSLNPEFETNYNFTFVSRKEWHAREPKDVTPLKTPVPYVVIHHTSTVPRCYDREACCESMREIQNYHMDEKGWWDIGYNFGVGSDGAVYEGRGWDILGAQSLHFNDVSIGITCIGNWTFEVPPERQLNTVKSLLQAGVDLGYVVPDYILFGHRDVRDTQCPGDALYGEIQTWPHYLLANLMSWKQLQDNRRFNYDYLRFFSYLMA